MVQEVVQKTKDWFSTLKTHLSNKDWKGVLIWAIPIILTVLVIAVFKIKVWTPAKRSYTAYRKRRYSRRPRRRYYRRYKRRK